LGDRKMIAKSSTELTSIFVWAGHFQKAVDTARRGLAYLEADVSADRALLLAALAQVHGAAGDYEPAYAAIDEALKIASQLSDHKLSAELYGARSVINYQLFRLREVVADAEKASVSEFRPWDRAVQLQILQQTFLLLGRPNEAARIRDELEPFATRIGQSYSIARSLITRAWVEFVKSPISTNLKPSSGKC